MKSNEFKMSEQHLGAVLVGLMACIAFGFLFLLFRSPTAVMAEVRVTDFAAEQAAGTLSSGSGAQAATAQQAEPVNIEGEFTQFDGQPGESQVDWPHFRGADHSNIVSGGTPLADSWEEGGPPQLWGPIDLGEGHGGAVVWKGRVYVMDYDKEKKGDALRCFSIKDGKEIWRRWYKAPTKNNHGVSRTTPAVTQDYTVTIGPRCHVMCVDTETGSFQWGTDMVAEYGTEVPLWYTGQCPLIDGDTLVLAPAGTKSLFVGLDIATGSVLWETPTPGKWKMTHSSVIPMTLLGKKMYIYCADGGVAGVSAEEEDRGKLLWKSIAWSNKVTSPSPLKVNDHQIFLTAGNGSGSLMLELKQAGDEIITETVFVHDKKNGFSCEQQTPILHQGHIFGILPKSAGERREQFACLNPKGEFVWTSGNTERYGLGPFLMGDGKFFILNDRNGELTMIKASLSGFEQLAKAKVLKGHDAWAPMALVDGKLLLRDSKQMICLDVSKQ